MNLHFPIRSPREAARRVGPAGPVAGVDPGRGMLTVAAELGPDVEWREADIDALTALFKSAGLTAVDVRTETGTARFPSIRTMVEADLRGWLPVMGVLLEDHQIQNILGKAELALADYVTREGEVAFDAPAHIVTGTRP